jgi:hypothetical protein
LPCWTRRILQLCRVDIDAVNDASQVLEDLIFLSTGTLSELLGARRIEAEALIRQPLARAGGVERSLNCFVALCPDTALAEARASNARSAKGQWLGLPNSAEDQSLADHHLGTGAGRGEEGTTSAAWVEVPAWHKEADSVNQTAYGMARPMSSCWT